MSKAFFDAAAVVRVATAEGICEGVRAWENQTYA